MAQLSYNKVTSKSIAGEKIHYGVVYGNEKIIFIKTGFEGGIEGYENKYLQMAHRVHERLGATVICASNPDVDYAAQVVADKAMISKAAAECGFAEYEVYFVGTSDGGYQNLLLAQQVNQTRKLLGINASLIDADDLVIQLQKLPHVKKILVYGTEDDDFDEIAPMLSEMTCDKLELKFVDGADHSFTGMVEEFIALSDHL
jgi:alpha/beta superfamily hydrolase